MTDTGFSKIIEKMPKLLEELMKDSPRMRDNLGEIPERGIYVFYEGEIPIYVGRSNSLKTRILGHGRDGSRHNSATFAFLLAKEKMGKNLPQGTRGELEKRPDFAAAYSKEKRRVSQMGVQVVGIEDPIEQTIFEVYASLALETNYNSFENH